MADLGVKWINSYIVEQYENGDVLIYEKRKTIFEIVFYAVVAGLCITMAIQLNSDWQYFWALGFFLGLSLLVFGIWRRMKPQRIFVSRERNHIHVQTMRSDRIVSADEIRLFRYWHEAVHTTTTGSVVGVGPKAHLQGIQIVFNDGSDMLILNLKTSYDGLSHDSREQEDGNELVALMQGSLRKHIEYQKI